MDNTLLTADLDLANHQGESWSKNIRGGILSRLAPQDPELKTGNTDHFTFTGTPKAELVGEGENKSSNDGKPTKATARTYTVQVTYRMSNQVLWADEDYQIGVVDKLVGNIAIALNRALDLIAIHGINPKTGLVSSAVAEYFTKAGNGVHRVVSSNDPDADLEEAAMDLQGSGYIATGIGFDPMYAGQLARVRDNDGRRLYPELGLGFGFDTFQGLAAASSDTVSARQELGNEDSTLRALMGDFNAFQWGVARRVPLETIQYGDPDGNGDLKRTNEIAIRAEAVLGFVIFDTAAFATIDTALAS